MRLLPVVASLACGSALCAGSSANAAVGSSARAIEPRTLVVCPEAPRRGGCDFRGDGGIQAAVDRASSGDTILVKAGRYAPVSIRETPYKDFTVRAYVLIEGKDVSILGEPGAVLDGGTKLPATAIAVRNSAVTLRNLEITGFRFDVEEDDYYEGHGIFVIDGRVRIEDVTLGRFQKMGLTGRGDTLLDVTRLQVLDGHVAIWLHETAHLRLRDSVVRGNDSSAIAAYDDSVAHVSGSVFDGNLDDGLYTEHRAAIHVTNSLLLRNKPYAARASGDSRIWIAYSVLFGNEAPLSTKDAAVVRLGNGVMEVDPLVDSRYRPAAESPLRGKGDPDFGVPVGTPSDIGLPLSAADGS
jgi:hypothetical protein